MLQRLAMAMIVMCALALLPGTMILAHAQSTTPSATTAEAPPAATAPTGTEARPQGLFAKRAPGAAAPAQPSGAFAWLMATQHKVHRALAAAVKDLKTGNPLWAALVLGFLSFSYGVLHAAGPGHGKAVISSYVLANERTVKRGIALSFLAAAIQGLSALVIVGILVLVMRSTSMEIKAAEGWIETASWALVTLIGVWLLYTQLRVLAEGWGNKAGVAAGHAHGLDHGHAHSPAGAHTQHDHHHHHDAGCCGHDHHHSSVHHHSGAHEHRHVHSDQHEHTHHVHHAHGDDCGCGHAHIPSPDQLGGPWSWSKALAVAFSVGIRPCTGAIIVLVFAISQGLMWAGVFATFAMALGTAITVSALAALAVGSRELATRMAGEGSRWGWRIERAAGLGGAVLVIGLGAIFFLGSLQPAAPF